MSEYDYRTGTTQNVGHEYEHEMCAYLAVAACNQEELKEFWIASNVDGVGAWDDIIIYTETKFGDKNLTFIQLKHKHNPGSIICINARDCKKDMAKYLQDIEEIYTLMHCSDANENQYKIRDILRSTGVPFENIEFVLMSNAKFVESYSENQLNTKKPKIRIDYNLIRASKNCFSMTNVQGSVYKISSNKTDEINFMDKLLIISEQSGVINGDLFKKIESQLKLFLNNANFMSTLELAKYLAPAIKDWFLSTQRTLSFADINEIISCGILSILKYTKSSNNKCDTLNIKEWEIFQKLTEAYQLVVFTNADLVLTNFFFENNTRFFIICEESEIDFIINCLEKAKSINIMLLVSNCKSFDSIIESRILTLISLKELPNALVELLNDYSIIVQGRKIKFSTFLSQYPDNRNHFTVDDILSLLTNKLSFGESCDVPEYYVSRWISRIFINKSIIFQICDSFLIIVVEDNIVESNYKIKEYLKLKSRDVASKDQARVHAIGEQNYKCVKNDTLDEEILNCKDKNVHVLKYRKYEQDFVLEWVSSTASISKLKDFIESKEFNVEEIGDNLSNMRLNERKRILITANPGMGKTCLMKHLANNYPENAWVILVTLNQIDFEVVHSFQLHLENYLKSLNCKDKEIFALYLKHKTVVVLFDGFDEIAPYNEKNGLRLITDASKQGFNVVVTSREVTRDVLERNMNVLSYAIRPFTNQDKILFLEKFFLRNVQNFDCLDLDVIEDRTKEFALKLLEKCSLSCWDEEFTGIPLQCRLLAEGFIAEFQNYCKSGHISHIPNKLNLIALYESFIASKLNIYIKEKEKLEATGYLKIKIINDLKDDFLEKHMNAAVQIIFPETGLKLSDKVLKEIKSAKEKMGIITGIDENRKPMFVHRTFAEYFAAKWLVDIKERNIEFDESKREEYLKFMLRPENNVVRDLFDRLLCAECDLHIAVLDADTKRVGEFLEESGGCDEMACGRSALHILSTRGAHHDIKGEEILREGDDKYLETLELLLEKGIWRDVEDEILRWTPKEYVNHKNAFGVIEKFLQYESTRLYDLENSFMEGWKKSDILGMCAKYDYVNIGRNIVDLKNLDSNETKALLIRCADNDSVNFAKKLIQYKELNSDDLTEMTITYNIQWKGTLLHLAAQRGSLKIIQELVKYIDVNTKDKRGHVPLEIAIGNGHFTIVKALMKMGADMFILDDGGEAPIDAAIINGNKELREYATSYDILKSGFRDDINAELNKENGYTALHYLAMGSNLPVLKRLIAEGANVNIPSKDKHTPLHKASAGWYSSNDVRFLVKSGANINAANSSGYTPLHAAAANAPKESVDVLLELGANPDIVGVDGRTPLTISSLRVNQNDDIFLLLWNKTLRKTSRDFRYYISIVKYDVGADVRKMSFDGYPEKLLGLVDSMAEAGLYVAGGTGDDVVCFSCKCWLNGWSPSDDPWVRHAKEAPNCQFVIEKKGLEFIESCQKETNSSKESEFELKEMI